MVGPVLPKSPIDLGNLLGFPPLRSHRKFKDFLPSDCRDMHCPREPVALAASEVWRGEGWQESPRRGAGVPGMSCCCQLGRRSVAAGLSPVLSGSWVGSSSTELFRAEYVRTHSVVPAECSRIIETGAVLFGDLQSLH